MEVITQFLTSDLGIMIIKCLAIFFMMVNIVPIMVWVERRGSALLQNRLGPNRVGPFGLLQSLADALKFIFKEDKAPGHVDKFYYHLAPVVAVMPAFMTFAVVPWAAPIAIGEGRQITFQLANLNIGFLFIFAVASLGVYGIIMGAWASNSKYALFGGLRSTSQMISYELSMGLSVIGMVMITQSVELNAMAAYQGEALLTLGPLTIPKWGILLQPIGFLIFTTAAFAETNRLPFDLPEGESEIVAGYHLEYGAMKFAIFMMAEYLNMLTASALITTLYFGGWQLLPGMGWILESLSLEGLTHDWALVAFQTASFFIKVLTWMWIFVWVRWTLPRFRYDQLMDLGWKGMLPLSLLNIFATGLYLYWSTRSGG